MKHPIIYEGGSNTNIPKYVIAKRIREDVNDKSVDNFKFAELYVTIDKIMRFDKNLLPDLVSRELVDNLIKELIDLKTEILSIKDKTQLMLKIDLYVEKYNNLKSIYDEMFEIVNTIMIKHGSMITDFEIISIGVDKKDDNTKESPSPKEDSEDEYSMF